MLLIFKAMKIKGVGFSIGLVGLLGLSAFAQQLDTTKIEQVIGIKGAMNTNEHVFKVTSPRTDVKVTVDGMAMTPFMGLASWAAFTGGGDRVMVMGDTVLFQDEVNPVMSVALDNGLSVTALHNHFFYDEPRVYFMHIGGEGSAETLATAVKAVWNKVKEIRTANAEPVNTFGSAPFAGTNAITAKPLEGILGMKGQTNSGMVKFVIGQPTKMNGMDVSKDMGANTWAAFAGTDDNALVDGDFAVQEDQLQDVLKTLRQGGVSIVAIHSHMSGEMPRILFLHYWGRGNATDLAKTLKAALDTQKKPKSSMPAM